MNVKTITVTCLALVACLLCVRSSNGDELEQRAEAVLSLAQKQILGVK